MSEINPTNDWNSFGHTHEPEPRSIENSVGNPQPHDGYWKHTAMYAVLGGVFVGMLSERWVNMFDNYKQEALESGVAAGFIVAASVGVIGFFKRPK